MIIPLAAVSVFIALWALRYNYLTFVDGMYTKFIAFLIGRQISRTISLAKFLSFASEIGYLGHILVRFACLGIAILGPAAIFLYQKKQNNTIK